MKKSTLEKIGYCFGPVCSWSPLCQQINAGIENETKSGKGSDGKWGKVFGPIFFHAPGKLTFAFLVIGIGQWKRERKKEWKVCAFEHVRGEVKMVRTRNGGKDCSFETVSGNEKGREMCQKVEMRMYIERVARSVIGFWCHPSWKKTNKIGSWGSVSKNGHSRKFSSCWPFQHQ